MSLPPHPGSEFESSFERDPRNKPSPRIPRPLPDNSRRAGTTAAALVAVVLLVIALLVLL